MILLTIDGTILEFHACALGPLPILARIRASIVRTASDASFGLDQNKKPELGATI